MKLILLVITLSSAFVAYGLSVDVNAGKPIDFATFKSTFKKTYSSPTENQKRKSIYESNLQKIAEKNQQAKEAGYDTKFGVNAFSDHDPAEFIKTHTGYKKSSTPLESSVLKHVSFVDTPKKATAIPTSWDWRALNKVSPVKDQGYCGSCWAFATASILETAYAIKYNTTFVPDLTEQELVDCAPASLNCTGCDGGDPVGAAIFTATYGLMQDSYYPYYEFQSFFCSYDKTQGGVIQPKNVVKYTGTEAALTQIVSQIGPVLIGMFVPDDNSFQSYVSGIFTDPECVKTNEANHAVVIEGYGTQNGKDYWLVRNSWGPYWGENGYFKLPRGSNYCNMMVETVYFTF